MTILDQIVAAKKLEVEERKSFCPVSVLEKSIFFLEKPRSLKSHLLREGSFGIISEFKRKSPSAGIINESSVAREVCSEYSEAGSSAVSVLTDSEFFGGSSDDLTEVRKQIVFPVLRKDFIIDEYQIIEARAIGADAVLLIAEIHKAEKLAELYRFACSFGLEVLVEVHDEKNISRIPDEAQIVGINSRNLGSFSVNLDHLSTLIQRLPENSLKVAESGIKSVSDYLKLKDAGFNAFLIGEFFMRTTNPGRACKEFIDALREMRIYPTNKDQFIRK
jgi:indole-3-glycerol phosphate synthase